ncbi:PrgI family protein [Hamadaea sp. NPDC051192]|uniref:PrgI family protein n=1 Tax=Hamadaea sp. NPDC051192 TaxID=3154940 RepID=UPI00344393A7
MSRIRAASVPADVTQPDRIFAGLTARQLTILGGTAAGLWLAHRLLSPLLPGIVLLIGAIPIAAIAIAVTIGRRDGLGLDRWLWHAMRLARAPKRHAAVAAPEAQVTVLRLPATGVDADGTVTLLDGQYAVLVGVGTVGFLLRGPDDQDSVLDGYTRWCAGLSGHTQITVSTRPVDLDHPADRIDDGADTLPDPGLAAVAADHARFLRQLAADRDPLRRQVVITHRGPDPASVRRTATHTVRALSGTGANARILDGTTVTDLLYAAADPWQPTVWGHALPDAIITATRPSRTEDQP